MILSLLVFPAPTNPKISTLILNLVNYTQKSFYNVRPKNAESPMFKIQYLMSKILICKKGATTFSMTTLSIMGLIEILRTNHIQHKDA